MKLDRLIGILAILLQRDKTTAPILAEKFEVSRRTINRDIDALCRAGIPIVTKRGADGGISILDGYKIDSTLLTSSDMQAILAGLRSLDSVSGTKRYVQLMDKLSAGSSEFVPGSDNILIDLSSWHRESLTPKIECILGAIENRRTVSFEYTAPKGEGRRKIEPYYLLFRWSSWYIWGWCELREDFRLFKLTRMTELKTEEVYETRPVPLPDLSEERIFPRKYKVRALFEPDCKWRLAEEFGTDSFEEREDGRLMFSYDFFSDAENIVSWILTFGDKAELMQPQELRNVMRKTSEKISAKYNK